MTFGLNILMGVLLADAVWVFIKLTSWALRFLSRVLCLSILRKAFPNSSVCQSVFISLTPPYGSVVCSLHFWGQLNVWPSRVFLPEKNQISSLRDCSKLLSCIHSVMRHSIPFLIPSTAWLKNLCNYCSRPIFGLGHLSQGLTGVHMTTQSFIVYDTIFC